MHQDHPCGAVPVSGINLSAWWCWHHQCWYLAASSYTQTGADAIEDAPYWALSLGPFDGATDVARELLGKLVDMLTAPGAPWGSAAEHELLRSVTRP